MLDCYGCRDIIVIIFSLFSLNSPETLILSTLIKALGNWSGKQRREEKQDELNPFKKAALERIGFTFDPKQQKWEVFHSKLKHFLSKHGQIPENLNDDKVKLSGIQRQLFYHQKLPKQILGEYKGIE